MNRVFIVAALKSENGRALIHWVINILQKLQAYRWELLPTEFWGGIMSNTDIDEYERMESMKDIIA